MIEIDDSDLQRAANLLKEFPGAVDRISKRAVRSSVKGVLREAVKRITERYTFQRFRISPTMRITYAGNGAVFSARGRSNDLAYFKNNPNRVQMKRPPKGKYLYSEVVKGQGGTIAHAFLARMQSSGHVGVFHRTNGNDSMPIAQNYGPSVPQMLGYPGIRTYMEDRLRERLSGAVDREVNNYLARYRR